MRNWLDSFYCIEFFAHTQHVIPSIPCSMKFLRDFYFEDWRFFEVCGNKFLWLQLTEISAGMELIFAGGFLFEQQNINKGQRKCNIFNFYYFFLGKTTVYTSQTFQSTTSRSVTTKHIQQSSCIRPILKRMIKYKNTTNLNSVNQHLLCKQPQKHISSYRQSIVVLQCIFLVPEKVLT